MSTLKINILDTPSGSGNITVNRPMILTAGDIVTADILNANVTTAKVADNAITLDKMAGGTDGQIITYDASGDPVAVGPGTSGQVLTSAGAGAPPTFAAAAAGGAWTVITRQIAYASASVIFTTGLTSTYDRYCITADRIICSSSSGQFRVAFSDDGGSSWEAGNTDYGWAYHGWDVGGTTVSGNSGSGLTSYARIGDTWRASITPASFVMWFTAPDESGTYEHTFDIFGSYPSSVDDDLVMIQASILFAQTTVVSGIKFYLDTGTLTLGTFTLYGIKNT